MDDWSLTLLACKVNLSGYRTGETIVLTGDPSDYAYIILGGSVKVRVLCVLYVCIVLCVYMYVYIYVCYSVQVICIILVLCGITMLYCE